MDVLEPIKPGCVLGINSLTPGFSELSVAPENSGHTSECMSIWQLGFFLSSLEIILKHFFNGPMTTKMV